VPFENSNREVKDGGWLATMRDRGLIYGAKGNKSLDFYSYDAQPNRWTVLPAIPDGPEGKPAGKGSCGTADGENSIYFVKGNNTLEFYRFLVNEGRYETLQVVPEGLSGKKVKGGGDMVFARPVDTQYVYFLKGYKNEFYRFNTTDREWQTLPAPPGEKWAGGSFLAYDGDRTIYAHKSKDNALYSFDLVDNRWNSRTLTGMPLANRFFPGKEKKSKDGANGVWFEGAMYATKGGNTQEVWKYVPGTTRDSWSEVDTIPQMGSTMRRKRIKAGGDIASYGGGAFFITKGNKTFEFWRYVLPAADRGRDGVTAGGVSIADCRLTVAPNPLVRGFATVRLGGPAAAWPGALVRVFDMTGRCVLTRPPDPLTPGILTLDMRGLSAGVYVVSFRAGELSLTQKLAIEN
jgi:hypothetical protein